MSRGPAEEERTHKLIWGTAFQAEGTVSVKTPESKERGTSVERALSTMAETRESGPALGQH